MIGEVLEKTDGTEVEILSEPYYLQDPQDNVTDCYVLAAYTSGPSAGKLEQIALDHIELYFTRKS
jgi:hypothetical protein